MKIEVRQQDSSALVDYASVRIAFEVRTIFDVAEHENGPGGFTLTERSVAVPYVKDYDVIDGAQPQHWATRFDVSNSGVFAAKVGGQRVGGLVVAVNTPGLLILEGRDDLAVIWDIRVAPDARGQGVGAALFNAAEEWAKARGCLGLKVETQNINVPACRFYARQGCVLTTVNRSAYPELPGEVQLIWYKELS